MDDRNSAPTGIDPKVWRWIREILLRLESLERQARLPSQLASETFVNKEIARLREDMMDQLRAVTRRAG